MGGPAQGVDIRRLRYFVAVCEHGGFSKAAPLIGIAQPALTRQVQLLEQELGVALFTRNGRSAVPTEVGAALLAGTRAHLESLDSAVERLRRAHGAAPVRMAVGICPTIVPLFQTALTDALRDVMGVTAPAVIEAYSGDLRRLLAAGELDLALTYSMDEDAPDAIPLLVEDLAFVATAPPAADPAPLSAVVQARLILPSRAHALRRIIDARAEAAGVTLTPALELDSLNAVKALVTAREAGYATILPWHSVASEAAERRLTLTRMDDPGMVRTVALIQRAAMPDDLVGRLTRHAADIRAQTALH